MTATYCPSTLKAMRELARRGANVAELARRLNWHTSAVARICARHGIEIDGGDPDADLRPALIKEPPFRAIDDRAQPRSHTNPRGRPERLPAEDLRSQCLSISVIPAVAKAVRARAKERNVTVSLICAELLKEAIQREAAVERGLS